MVRPAVVLALVISFASAAGAQQLPSQAAATGAKRSAAKSGAHIDGALRQMIKELDGGRPAAERPAAATRRVPVTIRFKTAADGSSHRDILGALGAVPANEYRNVVETNIRLDAIERLAANPAVSAVEWIAPPAPQVIGQGAVVHNATTWQSAGHVGAGVKVGVIDVGFVGLISLMGSELPATISARCYTGLATFTSALADCERTTQHGTAVAEAVVDIAPAVQLYVANPQSPLDLRNTVTWMTAQGVRVINHSVSWTWSGPGDGTTPFIDSPLAAVDDAVGGGAVWTNAAGNAGLTTWSGTYTDTNNDGWMEFSGAIAGNGVALGAGDQFIAQMRWEDSWSAAARDVDVYLVDSVGQIVAGSEAVQDGSPGSVPREFVVFTAPSPGVYYLIVHLYSGAAPGWLDIQAFSGETLQYRTAGHSIANPAETANPGALAVGAAPWSDTVSIEPFSSVGPTRDGRMKPDVTAADRADSVTYGPGGFAGTSQSAPHVAGLAALVLESFPATPPAGVANYLRTVAAPRGSPGNTFGAGFAQVPVFPATVSLSALLTSTTFPVRAGQPISWTAFAIGAQAPFEYRFWIFSPSNGWVVLRDYGAGNEITWTPPQAGTYAFQVWVRRVGSTAAYDDWRGSGSFVVNAPPPLAVALTASVSLPALVNTPITWTATATGGLAPLQYQFWRFREGAGWSMVRDYAGANTFAWTPGANDIGRYAMQVWVRNAGSTAAYDAWAGTAYFNIVSPPVVIGSLSANTTFPTVVGTPVVWTATASGGTSPLEYQFWRFKQGAGWTIVQSYRSLNTFAWTPSAQEAGSYALQVWVRQTGSGAPYEAWRGTDFFVVNPRPAAAITSVSQAPAAPAFVGVPITWAATATGGTSPLLYKFWLQASGTWTVLQDYSTVPTATWTPTAPGSYSAQVWVRSSDSTAAYEDWRATGIFTLTVSPTVYIASFAANSSLPATVTRPITWTAVAAGGTGPLQYQFWRYRQPTGWSLVQEYSATPTYAWTPAVGEEGRYAIQVWVRAAGSTAPYDAWAGTEFFQVLPRTVLYMVSVPGDAIGGGTTRLFTPADGNFTATRNFHNGVSLSEINPSYIQWWYLDFAAAGDVELGPGLHSRATRYPFQLSTDAALSVYGEGRGCNEVMGRFVVRDAVYATDGTPTSFAADFEQHCDGFAPALYGSIRLNSTAGVVSIRSIASSPASLLQVGVPVSWTAGVASGREYQAWLYHATTRTFTLLHDYTTDQVVSWTPQSGDQGDWSIVLWERPVGSTAAYDTWRTGAAFTVQ
jgi:hypothetical protein